MKVVLTDAARLDLEEILSFIQANYPATASAFERRLDQIARLIGDQPESGVVVSGRKGVRMVPFTRYPYRLFYRPKGDVIEPAFPG